MEFDANDEKVKEIWSRLIISSKKSDDGCLLFSGRAQYPYVRLGRIAQMNIYDFSYMLHFGAIPDGKVVVGCHCNKLCFNSSHLTLKNGKKRLTQIEYNEKRWKLLVKNSTTNEQGCMLFCGKKKSSGHGEIGMRDGNKMQVHLFSWLYHKGEIEKGVVVRHNCKQGNSLWKNNEECFNINHLSIGSCAENTEDSRRDGTMCVGENSSLSKLTEKDVSAIFYCRNVETVAERARKYNVAPITIKNIDNGRAWVHVTKLLSTRKKRKLREPCRQDYERFWSSIQKNSTRRGKYQCLIPSTPMLHNNYKKVHFAGKTSKSAHIIVAELFGHNCQSSDKCVRHVICGDKQCCEPSHLDFGSNSDNSRDTAMCSEYAKKALQIFETKGNLKVSERAALHNVTEAQIKNCDSGSSWGWLKERIEEQKIREENAMFVIRQRENGIAITKLSSSYLYDEKIQTDNEELDTEISQKIKRKKIVE